jgi:hypothetical protein
MRNFLLACAAALSLAAVTSFASDVSLVSFSMIYTNGSSTSNNLQLFAPGNVTPTGNFNTLGWGLSYGYHSNTNSTYIDIGNSSSSPISNGASDTFGIGFQTANTPGFISDDFASDNGSTDTDVEDYSAPAGLSLTNVTGSGGATKYLISQMSLTGSAGSMTQWDEIPYLSGQNFQMRFSNASGSTDTLSNVRFFTSDTQIPLDQLNTTDLPPSDPRFQPLPGIPDGSTIEPGGTLNSSEFLSAPEPTTYTAMAAGFAAMALLRRRATKTRVR